MRRRAGVLLLLATLGCAGATRSVPPQVAGVTGMAEGDCLGVGQDVLPEWDDEIAVDSPPRLLNAAPPEYPGIAGDARPEGTVVTLALICADGAVREVRIVHSIPLLDSAAAATVARLRFDPARRNGLPLAVWDEVPVTFRLNDVR